MKLLYCSALVFSLTAGAQVNQSGQAKGYSPNDGKTPPGTFETKEIKPSKDQKTTTGIGLEKQEQQMSPTSSESGINNPSGVTTDQMNTSPNTPPGSDQEVLRDTTLSTGPTKDPRNPAEIQAQDEESALDYSTTPEKKTKKKPNQ